MLTRPQVEWTYGPQAPFVSDPLLLFFQAPQTVNACFHGLARFDMTDQHLLGHDADEGGHLSDHPAPRYIGEDTRPTSKKELAGWYMYAFAAETYVICGES